MDMENTERCGTAGLSDALRELEPSRDLARHIVSRLHALRPQDRVLGPAYTIRLSRAASSEAGRRQAFLSAYDQAPPGAMVMVEAVGDVGGAVMGDLVARRLKAIGVAGVVIDGAVRDRAALVDIAPPTWFAQTAVSGVLSREVRTEVGVPVRIGDTMVQPGDIVCADTDGLFIAPARESERLLHKAAEIESREKIVAAALSDGCPLESALINARTDP